MTALINSMYHQHHLSCCYQHSWLKKETRKRSELIQDCSKSFNKKVQLFNSCHRKCKNEVYNRECQSSRFLTGCIIWPRGIKFWCTPPMIENALNKTIDCHHAYEYAHSWRYSLDILVFCPDFSDSDTKIIQPVGHDWHFQCLSWNILEWYFRTDGCFGCQICSKKYKFSYHSI